MITVTDHGVGMIESDLRLLFRDGVQFNPDHLQASGGSGLGLYIAQVRTNSTDPLNIYILF